MDTKLTPKFAHIPHWLCLLGNDSVFFTCEIYIYINCAYWPIDAY